MVNHKCTFQMEQLFFRFIEKTFHFDKKKNSTPLCLFYVIQFNMSVCYFFLLFSLPVLSVVMECWLFIFVSFSTVFISFQNFCSSFCLDIGSAVMIANIQQWKLHYVNPCANVSVWIWVEITNKTMIRLSLNVLGNWFTTTFCRLFFVICNRWENIIKGETMAQ